MKVRARTYIDQNRITRGLSGKRSSLQGYPVRGDKIPEACNMRTRHRRAYEGWPQEPAEGAQAKLFALDDGELNRDNS
jgi:hypothetical protein